MEFTYQDYPSSFKITDRYSFENQNIYMKWVKSNLFILCFASLISLFPLDNNIYGQSLAAILVITFLSGIAITFHIKNSKFEDYWYVGRALAESIKSLTWKYMTKGEPFGSSLNIELADKKFIEVIKKIFDENKDFSKINYRDDDGIQISDKMRLVRESSFDERKKIYISSRIKDQLSWYKGKSDYNKKQTSDIFGWIIAFQCVALLFSIYLIIKPQIFNVSPLLITFSACYLTWLQVKQHQGLSQSYAIAANDINLILNQALYINAENELEVFIADSENAFSREHTLWRARRDIL